MNMNTDAPVPPTGAEDAAPMPGVMEPWQPPQLQPPPTASELLLNRLLTLARRYGGEGQTHVAAGMYWNILERHPDTPAAGMARSLLLEQAASHERDGVLHLARAIYGHLLDLED